MVITKIVSYNSERVKTSSVLGVKQAKNDFDPSSLSFSELSCLVAQLCPAFCDPTDCSLPGSSVHGILLARILEWVAVPSSRGSSQSRG